MAMPEGDDRQETLIRERFFNAVMALGPFLESQCNCPFGNTRIVLDEDLAQEFIECEAEEDWQQFGYALVKMPLNEEWVVIQYGTPDHPNDWAFDHNIDPDIADFQLNIFKMKVGGTTTAAIVTLDMLECDHI